jgi:hypothetical protein
MAQTWVCNVRTSVGLPDATKIPSCLGGGKRDGQLMVPKKPSHGKELRDFNKVDIDDLSYLT